MKKTIYLFIIIFLTAINTAWAQQKIVAECTVEYSVENTKNNADEEAVNQTKTLYIKANKARIDVVSTSFTQSVLFDKTSDDVVVLREIGNNKVLTKLTKQKWAEKNSKYVGSVLNKTNETKTILGYECKKAILEYKDGSSTTLYYATAIAPSVKDVEVQFKDVPGFVLAYEVQSGAKKISYIATKINLSPVPSSKFDVPTSGYRILD